MKNLITLIFAFFLYTFNYAQNLDFIKTKIGFSTSLHYFDNFTKVGTNSDKLSSYSLPGITLSFDLVHNHSTNYFSQFSVGTGFGLYHFGYMHKALENTPLDNGTGIIERGFNDFNIIGNGFAFGSYKINRRFTLKSKHFSSFILGLGVGASFNFNTRGEQQSGSTSYALNEGSYDFFSYSLSNANTPRMNTLFNLRLGTEKVIDSKDNVNLFLDLNYSPNKIFEGTYSFNGNASPSLGTFSNNASSISLTIQYLFGLKK